MTGGGWAPAARLGRVPLPAEIGAQLWWNLPGLLGANLVFLLWCVPCAVLALLRLPMGAVLVAPLTVGPGLAGLMRYAARLARGEPATVWRDSLRGAQDGSGAASASVAVAVLAWQAHAVALAGMAGRESGWASVPMWAGQVSVLALAAMAGIHLFPLIGLYGQGLFEGARNALVLSARHPGAATAMLGLGAGAWALSCALGGAPLIILPAVMAVCAVNNTLRLCEGLYDANARRHRR